MEKPDARQEQQELWKFICIILNVSFRINRFSVPERNLKVHLTFFEFLWVCYRKFKKTKQKAKLSNVPVPKQLIRVDLIPDLFRVKRMLCEWKIRHHYLRLLTIQRFNIAVGK